MHTFNLDRSDFCFFLYYNTMYKGKHSYFEIENVYKNGIARMISGCMYFGHVNFSSPLNGGRAIKSIATFLI